MTQGTPQIGDDPDTAIPPTKLSSIWIPIAKGCGQVLNFNCALIVVPVITELLHWLHDVKVQQGREEEGTAHKGSETTLSKYVPLGKNITFHRYIAYAVALNVFVHTLAHFINYSTHPGETRRAYSINKLQFLPESLGVIRALEAWYTGVIIIVCMVFMYSAAQVTPPHSTQSGCFLPAVSWPWVPAWGSLEPPHQDGENAQKTRKNGEEMGEIRSKKCGQGASCAWS